MNVSAHKLEFTILYKWDEAVPWYFCVYTNERTFEYQRRKYSNLVIEICLWFPYFAKYFI